MKFIIAALLFCYAGVTAASPDITSKYLHHCTGMEVSDDQEATIAVSMCVGYIEGLATAHEEVAEMVNKYIIEHTGKAAKVPFRLYCIPRQRVDAWDLFEVVTKYHNKHPGLTKFDFPTVVSIAMIQEFPCSSK